MSPKAPPTPAILKLGPKDFKAISSFVYKHCGIVLPPRKKVLVESRLSSRVRDCGLRDFRAYCDLLFDEKRGADERARVIEMMTTNTTEFFREPHHFEFLLSKALPALEELAVGRNEQGVKLRGWSSACSIGAEPYTLAMILTRWAEAVRMRSFDILATDLSVEVLEKAHRAIYTEDQIVRIPKDLARRFLMRSRARDRGLYKIVPEIRERVEFQRLNLVKGGDSVQGRFDFVFCRNVLIYFDTETQEKVIRMLISKLIPGGFLFLGHSEGIHGMDLPLKLVGGSIYRHVPSNSGGRR